MSRDITRDRLGASITRAASLQTYYTIRLLVDRDRVADAYRAYAYFRWVDDWLDEPSRLQSDRLAFLARQQTLMEDLYLLPLRATPQGRRLRSAPSEAKQSNLDFTQSACPQERMLVTLVAHDDEPNSGLQSYIRNMMWVMAFDAGRRGRLISAEELQRYEATLAIAVTEALHHFIGHGKRTPRGSQRYLAVEAAHITHMLRDTVEDCQLGYFNIPREYLQSAAVSALDTDSDAYRSWVRDRVRLARRYFHLGRENLAQVECLRCRLAGYAYVARFETVLDSMEADGYRLRSDYSRVRTGPRFSRSFVRSAFAGRLTSS